MKTSASLFTGGGLFDIGAMAAGYKIIWGNGVPCLMAQKIMETL